MVGPLDGSAAFTFNPDVGHGLVDVVIDGVSSGAVPALTMAGITANHTILARFGVAPSITNQPVGRVILDGGSACFSVGAAGYPLAYQWLRDGVPVPGATHAIYVLPSAGTNDSGAAFAVTVFNPIGSVTSGAATLTVLPPGGDADGDGLSNAREFSAGTDPLNPDTFPYA